MKPVCWLPDAVNFPLDYPERFSPWKTGVAGVEFPNSCLAEPTPSAPRWGRERKLPRKASREEKRGQSLAVWEGAHGWGLTRKGDHWVQEGALGNLLSPSLGLTAQGLQVVS